MPIRQFHFSTNRKPRLAAQSALLELRLARRNLKNHIVTFYRRPPSSLCHLPPSRRII
jgi:hypothetical protein